MFKVTFQSGSERREFGRYHDEYDAIAGAYQAMTEGHPLVEILDPNGNKVPF